MALSSTSFKKGQSGNPGGLTPEEVKVMKLLKNGCLKLSPRALRLLEGIVLEMELGVRRIGREEIALLNIIIDRAIGKPAQTIINHDIDQDLSLIPADQMTSSQLELFMLGKSEEYLRSLHSSGKLKEIQAKLDEESASVEAEAPKE